MVSLQKCSRRTLLCNFNTNVFPSKKVPLINLSAALNDVDLSFNNLSLKTNFTVVVFQNANTFFEIAFKKRGKYFTIWVDNFWKLCSYFEKRFVFNKFIIFVYLCITNLLCQNCIFFRSFYVFFANLLFLKANLIYLKNFEKVSRILNIKMSQKPDLFSNIVKN